MLNPEMCQMMFCYAVKLDLYRKSHLICSRRLSVTMRTIWSGPVVLPLLNCLPLIVRFYQFVTALPWNTFLFWDVLDFSDGFCNVPFPSTSMSSSDRPFRLAARFYSFPVSMESWSPRDPTGLALIIWLTCHWSKLSWWSPIISRRPF